MGAIAERLKRPSAYAKLKRTVEETKYDAAIGLFNNHFEVMNFMMVKFLSQCFVARGLTEEKMVEYMLVGMGAKAICEQLTTMYGYTVHEDKKGLRDLGKFQDKISKVIDNRNVIIHGIHMKNTTGAVSINMKKTKRGKGDPQLKHTSDDIQKNTNYVAELTGLLMELADRVEKGIPLSGMLVEFNAIPVPEIGQKLWSKF